jgi:hypothetical protein
VTAHDDTIDVQTIGGPLGPKERLAVVEDLEWLGRGDGELDRLREGTLTEGSTIELDPAKLSPRNRRVITRQASLTIDAIDDETITVSMFRVEEIPLAHGGHRMEIVMNGTLAIDRKTGIPRESRLEGTVTMMNARGERMGSGTTIETTETTWTYP